MKDKNLNTVNLFEWTGLDGVMFTRSEEELREVFLNEDKSMRYLHEEGYCIDSFDPRDIDLVDGSTNLIRFNKFSKMNTINKQDTIDRDIFINACLQIGLYTHTLSSLNEKYLVNNYDEFSKYLPQSDVAYYKGIIQRNAGVYLCDFAVEKRNRDYKDLQRELSDDKDIKFEELSPVSDDSLINKEVNDLIYGELIKQKKSRRFGDTAYVYTLLLPTVLLTLGILICIIIYIASI